MGNLPVEVIRKIYSYDSTYKIKFDKVLAQLIAHCFIYHCRICLSLITIVMYVVPKVIKVQAQIVPEKHVASIAKENIMPTQFFVIKTTKHMHTSDEWKSRRVIIGGDFNTRSVLWNSKRNDHPNKTHLTETFILEHGLSVLNTPNHPATRIDPSGRAPPSWIDVTLISDSLAPTIKPWKVLDMVPSYSDHRYV